MVVFCAACSHKQVARTPPAPKDNSYLDLAPGSHLRILVPLLKDGQTHLALDAAKSQGSTITLSAANLIGYELSYYSAQAQRKGRIRLHFVSAERSKDGQTVPLPSAPQLPFPLPRKAAYIRLVFLVRVSESDHNMAIISAKTRPAVEALTARLKQHPNDCNIGCVWVPQGVAVRPQ
jgi:hypothetical protein